jgi:hypothetical protein
MSILDNKIIDLMKIENIATLSMAEQKNLAILITAKNELSRLSKKDCDSFTTRILDYLNQNVISFSELDSLFTEYFEEKNPMKKNIIFKKIKPIEPLAVYLSEIAVIFNKVSKTHEITIKGFVYNLILYWFEAERRKSNYLSAISDIQFQPHIDELVKRTRENKELRNELKDAFDNSIDISNFLLDFKLKPIIPNASIKGKRKK